MTVRMIVYLMILGAFLLLMLAGQGKKRRTEEYFETEEDSGMMGTPVYRNYLFRHLFLMPAVFLYDLAGPGRHVPESAEKRSGGDSSSVSADLRLLYPQTQVRIREAQYRIRKTAYVLLIVFAGDLLALAVGWMQMQEQEVMTAGAQEIAGEDPAAAHGQQPAETEERQYITRNPEGGADKEVTLLAPPFGEYTFTVRAQRYTPEECADLSEEVGEVLRTVIPAENESLENISSDLFLPYRLENFPFSITWESSAYDLVDSDGTVFAGVLEGEETRDVLLTAVLSYEDFRTEIPFQIRVVPPKYTDEEVMNREITDALLQTEAASIFDGKMPLPAEVNGQKIVFLDHLRDSSMPILLLFLAAGGAWYLSADRQLHQKVQERSEQMQMDYPGLISRIVLLLGAGMSVRNMFYKLAQDYRRSLREGEEPRYIYEEILQLCNEFDSGIAEPEALSNFSRRCRSRQYTKLCSLLIRNRSKGSGVLLAELQEEAEYAFEARKSMARKLGEEAGTKLLLPMMLMLAVTLMMILLPAMFRFSL